MSQLVVIGISPYLYLANLQVCIEYKHYLLVDDDASGPVGTNDDYTYIGNIAIASYCNITVDAYYV